MTGAADRSAGFEAAELVGDGAGAEQAEPHADLPDGRAPPICAIQSRIAARTASCREDRMSGRVMALASRAAPDGERACTVRPGAAGVPGGSDKNGYHCG
ncbi:hypothetical protein AADR41_22130 [Streptomyces sp. CLV115]|uniref:hypothetical protein n=1 Tax=Streptomyces sp. CLV115 TaxID=3138502 RepID=UPI00313EFF95